MGPIEAAILDKIRKANIAAMQANRPLPMNLLLDRGTLEGLRVEQREFCRFGAKVHGCRLFVGHPYWSTDPDERFIQVW